MNRQRLIGFAGALLLVCGLYTLVSLDTWRQLLGLGESLQDGKAMERTSEWGFDPETRGSLTFETMEEEFGWQEYYNPFAPKPGELAPDFELNDVNGENPVRLSDFRGKRPVALVFGSFT